MLFGTFAAVRSRTDQSLVDRTARVATSAPWKDNGQHRLVFRLT